MIKTWKPFLHRAITGQWNRFHMKKIQVPYPKKLLNPGLYLHVPFCEELCPFCPYNREKYEEEKFRLYENAVCREISMYARNLPQNEYISLYIGGGTPTINVPGLIRIIEHIKKSFNLRCDICIELHPNYMDNECLSSLKTAGVTLISIGVESTNDKLLENIGRSHDGATAMDSVKRAVSLGFKSVNVDLMFALPGQTLSHVDDDLRRIIESGVDQISTYPIFGFPYSDMGQEKGLKGIKRPVEKSIRDMFDLIAKRSLEYGFKRCAVWSFLKPSKKKFSSITRHHYIGFGPSAASMTGDYFYVNTFSSQEYVAAVERGLPIALGMKVPKRIEMAYWLYWRVYEMMLSKNEFNVAFNEDLRRIFGKIILLPRSLGMVRKNLDGYEITESGAYWIHRIQNEYSLNYINRLWGKCRLEPWPEEVIL